MIPLFDRFPALEGSVPWVQLVDLPTPVQRLDRFSDKVGGNVWIKRDDLTSTVYGGNKPRKLEFLLARAKAMGKCAVATGGGIGSNHSLATAIFGRQLGLKVTLGLFEQPVTPHVRDTLLSYHAQGAEMIFMGSVLTALVRYNTVERFRNRDALFIPPGGSNSLGVLGFVNAGLELAAQVAAGDIPQPAAVFTPVGTGGTLAGLVLGLKLAGLDTEVVGVRVAPGPFASANTARKLASGALRLMQRHDRSVPSLKLTKDQFEVAGGHYGKGYGHPTPKGEDARQLLRETEGVVLESTYTAKALSALVESVPTTTGPLLFWNTFSAIDLAPLAKGTDPKSLPPAFHRFFR